MSKLMTRAALGVVTAGLALSATALATTGASAATTTTAAGPTTTTTLAPPAQGVGLHALFLYVDTIQGAGGKPAPPAGCAQTNLFEPGQVVVFRMYGINVVAGGLNLNGANVANSWVKVPGVKAIPFFYGNHGKFAYFTAAWTVAKNYPLGIVNFVVHVVTKPVPASGSRAAVPAESGIFTQAGLAPPSQLTVVKA